MSTRYLVTVYDKNGDLKLAEFGRWDGYIEDTGVYILEFLKKKSLSKFQSKLKYIKLIDTNDNSDNFSGANILYIIQNREEIFETENNINFNHLSYMYEINFQKNQFILYHGRLSDFIISFDLNKLPTKKDFIKLSIEAIKKQELIKE